MPQRLGWREAKAEATRRPKPLECRSHWNAEAAGMPKPLGRRTEAAGRPTLFAEYMSGSWLDYDALEHDAARIGIFDP
jgi:hypothetical protein